MGVRDGWPLVVSRLLAVFRKPLLILPFEAAFRRPFLSVSEPLGTRYLLMANFDVDALNEKKNVVCRRNEWRRCVRLLAVPHQCLRRP